MISVIMTTRNGSKTIERAIKSIQDQTEKEFELIIVSDASTDDTVEKIQRLATEDSRIKPIILDKNIGPGGARRLAIEKSAGELIAILDDDDLWLSTEKLAIQKKYLDENPDYVLVGSSLVEFVDEDGKHLFSFESEKNDCDIKNHMLMHNPFVTSAVMFRKSAYDKAGKFSDLRLAEEYELWLKMGKIGKMANLNGCEVQYTSRKSGLTLSKNQEMNLVVLDLIKRHKKDYPLYTLAFIKAHLRILIRKITD
jgi:glycosyltransferase involved in cell wall biosynthesis